VSATAVVVGSGPNGLAAAITLAAAGVEVRVVEAKDRVGGGARSSELTLPGLVHDDCSAFHPFGVGSPFLSSLGLEARGLRWRWPEVQIAHPLDGGRAGIVWRDLERTAEGFGADGDRWRATFGPLVERFGDLSADVLGPLARVPRHPVTLARFGLLAVRPAAATVGRFRSDEARGAFGGVAAHAFTSLQAPLSSAAGVALLAAAHVHGWPVAEGGSQALTDALAATLRAHGGAIETGVEVTDLTDVGRPDLLLLDVAPAAVARILGDRLPARVRRAYDRFPHGPAAFKVDLAVEGDIPWAAPDVARAGTVHLGGSFEEIAAAERQVARRRMPTRPFVLVGQQYVADPSRSRDGVNPVWAYAHVPHGHRRDAVGAVLEQIERFAPGFRRRVVATHVRSPADLERYDANYVGGDISTGANGPMQLLSRPRLAIDPYATGVPGAYLCSAATPPGGGVHGMCGHHAANHALRWLERR
jgi:phytoene dehydrogenase-like protein